MTTPPRKQILGNGKYLKLVKEGTWEFADRGKIRAVAIIPMTRNGELVLTEQYRVPVKANVIDVPAGLVGDDPGFENEPEEQAARRELLEETGYQARTMKRLVCGPTTAGMASELVTFYLAKGLRKVADGGGVESESIQVHVVPVDQVMKWLRRAERQGKLIDLKTYFAASWLASELKST